MSHHTSRLNLNVSDTLKYFKHKVLKNAHYQLISFSAGVIYYVETFKIFLSQYIGNLSKILPMFFTLSLLKM